MELDNNRPLHCNNRCMNIHNSSQFWLYNVLGILFSNQPVHICRFESLQILCQDTDASTEIVTSRSCTRHLEYTIMATTITRATRSALLESGCFRSRFTRSMSPSIHQELLRPFSTAQRHAAPPAATYVRKAAAVAKPAPAPTKVADVVDDQSPIKDMTSGLADEPLILDEGDRQVDWTRSFHGLSAQPFSKEAADILLAPIPSDDVECKPDGIIYLPEIKYRRILNKAFGPGGWGLAPRGETIVTSKSITREYALVAHGRYVYLFHRISSLSAYVF